MHHLKSTTDMEGTDAALLLAGEVEDGDNKAEADSKHEEEEVETEESRYLREEDRQQGEDE